jgi:hypothetical protein
MATTILDYAVKGGQLLLTAGGIGIMWKIFSLFTNVKQWAIDVKDNHLHTIEKNTSITAEALEKMAPAMATLATEMGKMRESQQEQALKDAEFKGEVRGAIQAAHKNQQ